MTAPHLEFERTSRGFIWMPPIPATHGGRPAGNVRVYESSAAEDHHLWLQVHQPADRNHPENGKTIEATIHVRASDMRNLAEQILWLIDHRDD